MPTIAERVAAGAAFLDEHEPGWWQYIDLRELDIDSVCRCILGQLHDDYRAGRLALGLRGGNRGVALGFYPSRTDAPTSALLTAEWKLVITERRLVSAERRAEVSHERA